MPRKPAPTKQPSRARKPRKELTASEFGDALKAAGIKRMRFTPLKLLAFILKLVLKDRVTDREIKLICDTHRDLIKEFWGKSSN